MATENNHHRGVLEAKASARHVRVTPQKARRIIDLIRGKQAVEAVADRCASPRRPRPSRSTRCSSPRSPTPGSRPTRPLRRSTSATSSISLGLHRRGPDHEAVPPACPGPRGRINKRTSHITVVVRSQARQGHERRQPLMGQKVNPQASVSVSRRSTRAVGSPTPPRRVSATATTSRKTSRSASSCPRAWTAPASPASRSSAPVTGSASTSTPRVPASSSVAVAPRPTASAASSRSSPASRCS